MKQYEAVIKVMENNGGFATFGHLYQEVVKIPGVQWGTKTPNASIRRIVQVHKDKFFKIRPGLWGLIAWKQQLPDELRGGKPRTTEAAEKQRLFDHSYYQGLILDIGNRQKFQTYIPPQDKNRLFLGQKQLGSIATCPRIYNFAYQDLLRSVRSIDVIWFNRRKMPAALFEVEHTSDMTRAMVKFNELRDFRTQMYVVAQESRRSKFRDVSSLDTFTAIKGDVRFLLVSYHD